jgi:mannosyl-3-phosphoglycerate phosphatase
MKMADFLGDSAEARLLVLTDFDGSLLDQKGEWQDARSALTRLRQIGAHVVPVTSKTAFEVRPIRSAMSLRGAYAVESGSGVYALPWPKGEDVRRAGYSPDAMLRRARSYSETRQALRAMGRLVGRRFIGFGDLTPNGLASLIGSDAASAMRARARRWSEPFVPPTSLCFDEVVAAARQLGFDVLQGNRFWHLVTQGVDKGAAARLLIRHYRLRWRNVSVIAIGNGPNDKSLLEQADSAFVVPGPRGPDPSLLQGEWEIVDFPGAAGWAAAVSSYLGRE